jgi:L-arabinose isomerase
MQKWEVDLPLQSPQGYFKPNKDLSQFLTEYSMWGGSHHLAVSYGDCAGKIARLAALCGVEHVHI